MKELNIIVKADVQGSVEAVKQSLLKIENDEVNVKIVHGAVGTVSESDVMLAEASKAIIVAFNTGVDQIAADNAKRDGIEIKQYNIIFLDINMDDVDGIVTAQKIREYSSEIYIVFVTAYINYSLEGYKVEAIRYLLKNNTNLEASISECMDAILHKMNLVVKKKKFKFNEGEKEINIDNILYIESKLHKLQFYIMEDKIKIYNLYGTLNELENELKDFHFIRIHQSYLTNLKYIRSVKYYKVLLCNNQELLIPKARYKNVKDAFISYKGEL